VKISHILLVFSALLCIARPVVAQGSNVADATVIIKVDDYLITSADAFKEARRLFHQNPLMEQEASKIIAISNLVRQALTLQAAAKLEVPLAHYHSAAGEFVLKEIERAGSKNNFLLEKNNELGMLDTEEFHDFIYHSFVHTQVMGIVTGNQETAGKGLRVILDPSPAEIRRAYKDNQEFRMAPEVIKWSYLKFYKKSNSGQMPTEIVAKALADLDDGSISAQELINLADDAIANVGQPEDTATWIIDFVSSASTGEYRIAEKNNLGSQGSVSMIIVTESVPARAYSFNEAQPVIAKLLTDKKREKVVEDFYAETAAVVDIWVTDDVPGLKNFVSQMIGRHIPANNPEEL